MFMKLLLNLAVLALGSSLAVAADLTTESGKIYRGTELRKISAGCVQIVHADGNATLMLAELPENFIAALSVRQRYALQSLCDIELANGSVYRKTTIAALGNGNVTLLHAAGTIEIPAGQLPKKYLATFTARQLAALKQPNAAPAAPASAPNPSDRAASAATAPATAAATETDAAGRTIFTGPRGGRYYLNDSGKKVYLKKR